MGIYEHIATFAGRPVVSLEEDNALSRADQIALRIDIDYDTAESGVTITDIYARLAGEPELARLEALVIGSWGEMWESGAGPVVEGLVALRDRLSGLKALFLGEITAEECEISWIQQTDCSPLWDAFPRLEELRIRGGEGLSLGRIRHASLKKLVLEAGGLPAAVVRQVASADLPQLEHLELWLGTSEYGGDSSVDDLAPLLAGEGFPSLKTLALRNSVIADEVAEAVAAAPILERIDVLDLSLGTLGDAGAQALLDCGRLGGLQRLDLHHHFISDSLAAKLSELPIDVDISEKEDPHDWGDGEQHRYVSVSE